MRSGLLAGMLLVISVSGCGGSKDDTAAPPSATTASPSPSASRSYVSQVNALCESMIPEVMAVRGDQNGDGGGDFAAPAEVEAQEAKLRPIFKKFDAAVDAIPVTKIDRAAAEAFNAYRKIVDAEGAKMLAAAKSGDEQKYADALKPSAEFEAKRGALEAAGISCPAR